uniref:SRS domain-containing protein n=1 Tax=Toxoplasma gondii (strain ATCC 50861 / VEG) TaxID=432359 RepID=A0A0F7UWI1_TOXGV|nr:TPA: hypothetical protein BN1205_011263 [Toxoplasma gondii VEG]
MAISRSMRRRRGGFGSKARNMIAVCMGGVLLFCSGEAVAEHMLEGIQRRNLNGTARSIQPEIKDAVATCTLKAEAAAPTAVELSAESLKLSEKSLTATLKCVGEQIATIPEHLDAKVCDPSQKVTGENDSCKIEQSQENGKEVTLRELLGATREINWTKRVDTPGEKTGSTQTWSLDLQASDLPRSGKAFFVGCKTAKPQGRDSSNTEVSICKVPVTVEARASFVGENNVVTCAYGKDSNPRPLEVEISADNDALTIDCGTDGSLKPTNYTEEFCVTDNSQLESCTTKKFSEILRTFLPSWWVSDSQNGSAKLTIPESGFPEEQQQFRLGCIPKKTTESPQASLSVNTEKKRALKHWCKYFELQCHCDR